MIKYEFPLNERVRKFLRIEEIFEKMEAQISTGKKFSDYNCFDTYFDVMASASRTDLKVELIQEIEKQRLKIKNKIKTKKNLIINSDLKRIRITLEKSKISTGFNFGGDKFLHELKTRADSPTGILTADFPEFQYWLKTTQPRDRKNYFKEKLSHFAPIKVAIKKLMNHLRDNVKTQAIKTESGTIQYKLNPLFRNDLVIITLPSASKYFPNISSNKYAVNIHFVSAVSATPFKLIKFRLGTTSF